MDSGSVTLHRPFLSARIIGDLVSSQSLKSPTRETFPALGATKTNLTTVSETGELFTATGETRSTGGRPPRFAVNAPAITPIPTKPAASSEPVMGDSVHERGAITRSQMEERERGSGSARTAAMIRALAAGSVCTGRRA